MSRNVCFLFATDGISFGYGEWALPSHGRTQAHSSDAGDDLGHLRECSDHVLKPQYEECRTDPDPGNGHPHAGECSGFDACSPSRTATHSSTIKITASRWIIVGRLHTRRGGLLWSDLEAKVGGAPVPSHSRHESVTWDPDEFSRKPRGGARPLFSGPVPHGPGHRVRRHRYLAKLSSHIRRVGWRDGGSGSSAACLETLFSLRPILGFPRIAWWSSGCRCSCSGCAA